MKTAATGGSGSAAWSLVLSALACGYALAAAPARSTQPLAKDPQPIAIPTFTLSNRSADTRPYRGHGMLSAGASSRLLLDYPAKQRSEILDVLFKKGYGASLDMLKIEIGESARSRCLCLHRRAVCRFDQ